MGILPTDLTSKYNTPLDNKQESQFQSWQKAQSAVSKRDISKDLSDYDMRGYWQQRQSSPQSRGKNGHYPDTFKKPSHPTFSDESKYSTYGTSGGHWVGDKAFVPSGTNAMYHNAMELSSYFKRNEPNVRLIPSSVYSAVRRRR